MVGLLRKLNVEEGEEKLIGLLFLHSFFNGGMNVFGFTAAWALFLEAYGSEGLPVAYIIRALLVALSGYLLYRIQPKISMKALTVGRLCFC